MFMFPPFIGFVRVFVLACTIVFGLTLFAQSPAFGGGTIYESLIHFFGLQPALVMKGMIFQTVTWVFFHGSFMHLLFNMLAFWMFGSMLEQSFGTGRFLRYNLWCAIFTALFVVGFGFFDPITYNVPTIGASGLVFGILISVARLYPNQNVLFFGIFPMKMKFFALLMIGIEFYMLYGSNQHGISNIAHLGGALFGFLYIGWYNGRGRGGGGSVDWFKVFRDQMAQKKRKKHLRIVYPDDNRKYH